MGGWAMDQSESRQLMNHINFHTVTLSCPDGRAQLERNKISLQVLHSVNC
jgi:hypothetical protein